MVLIKTRLNLDVGHLDDLGVNHNNDYLDGQTRPYGAIFARHGRGTQSHISFPQVLFIQHYHHHLHCLHLDLSRLNTIVFSVFL